MKLSNKQKSEIDFLCKDARAEEIEEYINISVHGKGKWTTSSNRICKAKWNLDIQVKLWTRDIVDGIISYSELVGDFNHPFLTSVMNTVMKNLISKGSLSYRNFNPNSLKSVLPTKSMFDYNIALSKSSMV